MNDYFAQKRSPAAIPAEKSESLSFILELLVIIVTAAVMAYFIQGYLIKPFSIPSESMEPSLFPGDHVLVNRLVYRFSPPRTDEVVVFSFPRDPSVDFIKRIVAVPGDNLTVENNVLHVNGQPMRSGEVRPGATAVIPPVLGENEYFVMGDNRHNSEDSRVWGVLPKENIRGKAFVIYWPISRWGVLH